MEKEIEKLKGTLEAALRIQPLWGSDGDFTEDHSGEMRVLKDMETDLRSVLDVIQALESANKKYIRITVTDENGTEKLQMESAGMRPVEIIGMLRFYEKQTFVEMLHAQEQPQP